MQINKWIFFFLFLAFGAEQLLAQSLEQDLLKKYQNYRQRLENEFVVISPDVELYGVNIPAIDRKTDPYGNQNLRWSDGNSNFNNYISMLVTEITLLKQHGQDYQTSLNELVYTFLAIERLDLYSEYNLRKFWNDKILHDGDSTNAYIKYPADINGFMLRDDVSFGFWRRYHTHFGIEFGKPNENLTKTNKYFSVFQQGIEPMQAMSQDNVIRMLEALALTHHLMGKEPVYDIPLNFINPLIPHYLKEQDIMTKDSVDFKRWTEDLTTRLIKNMQQPEGQSAMCLKPWYSIGRESKNQFLSILSTRWYMSNPVREKHVAEGSGNDMGIFINAYGLGEYGNRLTGKNDFHFEGSQFGLKKYLFYMAVFKEIPLPLGAAIPLPKNFDDVLPRTLAASANISSKRRKIFLQLRDKRADHTFEHMIMTNYLMNKEDLADFYHPGTEMWTEDSTFIADILAVAPPNGPFSDTSKPNYSVHWCTSSRVIWPAHEPSKRATKDFEFAGIDYLMLHNLYRLVYGGDNYYLNLTPIRKRDMNFNKYTHEGKQQNSQFFIHAPVIIREK
ncbi:MAG: hypothetical protein PF448_12040 [Bacteroidales bacterium]|jgi:hypothetical protein|nr:hypothetical protein [Bacteroidales bacterium]